MEAHNGHATDLQAVEATESVLQHIFQIDSRLDRQLWHSNLRGYLAGGLCLVLAGMAAWGWSRERPLEIFLQPVLVHEELITAVGRPRRLADYHYSDAQWMDFLRDWVRLVRPRNGDPEVSTRALWKQAGHHVCGEAARKLTFDEAQERPFIVHPVRREVGDSVTITKIAEKTFHLGWTELVWKDGAPVRESWAGTFRVAKFQPKVVTENYQGMCVAWYSWTREGTL